MHAFSQAAPKLLTALLAYELNQDFSREQATILAGNGADRVLELGTILGLETVTAVSFAADAANVGNGVLTLASPAVAAGIFPGNYRVVFVEAEANAGRFEVFDPNGISLGHGTVGVAYTGLVKFTIADGATDFKAGDGFTITVPNEGTKLVEIDPAALDGSFMVDSVLLRHTTAPDGVDAQTVVLRRGPAILKAAGIVWPDGISDQNKALVTAELLAKGILIR